jgi:K+-transporting ATPase c subunit
MLSLQNAEFQLECVAAKWAADLERDAMTIREEIRQILMHHAVVPSGEPTGVKFVNVYEINQELRKRYGPSTLGGR